MRIWPCWRTAKKCGKLAVACGLAPTQAWKVGELAHAHSTVVFYPNSTGRVTTIIYEAEEIDLIGKYDVAQEKYGHYVRRALMLTQFKTYICTSLAMQHGLCTQDQLGYYIVDNSTTVNTIQQKQFDFGEKLTEPQSMTYPVTSTGFYCVGVMPLTTSTTAKNTERFHGHVEYHNRFDGQLAAAEHPKLYVRPVRLSLILALLPSYGIVYGYGRRLAICLLQVP